MEKNYIVQYTYTLKKSFFPKVIILHSCNLHYDFIVQISFKSLILILQDEGGIELNPAKGATVSPLYLTCPVSRARGPCAEHDSDLIKVSFQSRGKWAGYDIGSF